jgi:thiamine biosynthesis lipoprotein
MLSVEFRTMGCEAHAFVDATGPQVQSALDKLPAWFARREALLSRFDPDSALSQLNARGGGDYVDEVLWRAIDVALGAAAATHGVVTPTVLPALESAGYDKSFDVLDRDNGVANPPVPVVDFRAIERNAKTRSIRLPEGARLDLGGTAKGWCADLAAAQLARLGPALVDVGGDIAVAGHRATPWTIAIDDPRDGVALDLLMLPSGGVATSGRDYRRWTRAGRARHHVIDPRTGAPAQTDVLSVTVVARSALAGEVAAKYAMIRGSDAAVAWADTMSNIALVVVTEDGDVKRSAGFQHHVWSEPS